MNEMYGERKGSAL